MGRFLCSAAAALALSGGAWAGHGPAGMSLAQASAPVCGEHMMSAQERDEHRRRMHEAPNAATSHGAMGRSAMPRGPRPERAPG